MSIDDTLEINENHANKNLITLRHKKAPDCYGIMNELLKYCRHSPEKQFYYLIT